MTYLEKGRENTTSTNRSKKSSEAKQTYENASSLSKSMDIYTISMVQSGVKDEFERIFSHSSSLV